MGWSFVYLGLCRLFQLVVLLCRSERSKELEILLLRHELAFLRRQPRPAKLLQIAESPLTDSNRRPPPYHRATSRQAWEATGTTALQDEESAEDA